MVGSLAGACEGNRSGVCKWAGWGSLWCVGMGGWVDLWNGWMGGFIDGYSNGNVVR